VERGFTKKEAGERFRAGHCSHPTEREQWAAARPAKAINLTLIQGNQEGD
jgi:hypothetical protein